jgi:CRISPR-associated protein Cmr5
MTAGRTNGQRMAQTAYQRISQRVPSPELSSFARSFPSLIHACGLAQAVAFARAKKQVAYLEDLAEVLRAIGFTEADSVDGLERATRDAPVPTYVRLSRNALQAAGWLKRYVEAIKSEVS